MASYVSALSLDLYIYVTHVYFWGNFNRLFRYWFARVCDGVARDCDRFSLMIMMSNSSSYISFRIYYYYIIILRLKNLIISIGGLQHTARQQLKQKKVLRE